MIKLHDGNVMPAIGLGVYQASSADTFSSVLSALEHGYRHIDTAALYRNEAEVGAAIRNSGIPRDQIFVTTKLWNTDHGYQDAVKACESSLKRLGLDYVDLYLMYIRPCKRLESWKALEYLKDSRRCRSIGVSNYNAHHLEEILNPENGCKYIPAVNQIEMHPYLYGTRTAVIDFCNTHDIRIVAYSPLTRGKKLKAKPLVKISDKYFKSSAQILIKWCLQKGFGALPKSVTPERIVENFAMDGWGIDSMDMEILDGFDEELTTGWDPLAWD